MPKFSISTAMFMLIPFHNNHCFRKSGISDKTVEWAIVPDNVTKPSFNEAVDVITVLENYSLFSKLGFDLMKAPKCINRATDTNSQSNKKQRTLTNFFA